MQLQQQRQAASSVCSSALRHHQVARGAGAAWGLPVSRSLHAPTRQQQVCRAAWSSSARLHMHTSAAVPRAAAADEAAAIAGDALLEESPEEAAIYEPGFVNFACITGTVMAPVRRVEGKNDLWLLFKLKVPTPACEGTFTDWTVLAHGEVARLAQDRVKEGTSAQVSGTFLQRASIERHGWGDLLSSNAVFAESIGYLTPLQAEQLLQEVRLLPQMTGEDLEAFISSGGQQTRAAAAMPPPPPAAARAAAAAPVDVPGMPAQPSNDVEAAWMSIFRENHLWIDQRATKTGRQPDFKLANKSPSAGGKDAVWLTDRMLPAWVRRNLQLLPGNVPFPTPSYIPAAALSSTNPKEQQWVEVFSNYGAFWDNRVNKTNPRAPDFSPKNKESGGPVLWLSDRELPAWVLDNLSQLPDPPPPRS